MKRLRERLTYANVTSTLALFLALAGGTTAVALSDKNKVKHDDLADDVVHSPEIKKGEVKASDIAKAAVRSGEIQDGKVKAADLADGAVGPGALQAVPAARIEGGGDVLPDDAFTVVEGMTDTSSDAYDPLDMWTASDPSVLTVPVDGMYVATGGVTFSNDDTATPGLPQDNGYRLVQVSASNGENQRVTLPPNRFNNELTVISATLVARLSAGDQITLAAAQSNEDNTPNTLVAEKLAVTWAGPAP